MANTSNPISDKDLTNAILEDRPNNEMIDEACFQRIEQLAEEGGDERAIDLLQTLRKILC